MEQASSSRVMCCKYELRYDLDFAELQKLFKNGVTELTMLRGDEAVNSFNSAIQEIRTNFLATIFLHRAAAHETQGKLELALQDSLGAIKHAPQSSDGYIYAFNLHLRLKHLREALLVVERGLVRVAISDPRYAAFAYLKSAVLAEIDHHNTLSLPYDVVSDIMQRLSFPDRVRLASTCKYWKRMLYDSPPVMWRDLDIRSPMSPVQFRSILSHVKSQYVRVIKVNTVRILKEVAKMKWHHIECLDTESIFFDSDSPLTKVIWRNRDSLKELSITSISSPPDLTAKFINGVTRVCPHITSLTLHSKLYEEQRILMPPPSNSRTTAMTLTHLSLNELRSLSAVLPHCPNLQYLELFEQGLLMAHPPMVFFLIDRWCPKLIGLRYSPYSTMVFGASFPDTDLSDTAMHKYISEEPAAATTSGLRELTYLPRELVDTGISDTIKRNQSTLQSLRLNTTVITSQKYELLAALSEISSTRHQALREIEFAGKRTAHFARSRNNFPSADLYDIIKTCISLESVRLRDIVIDSDDLFYALSALPRLRRLYLIRCPMAAGCRHGRTVFSCGFQYLCTYTETLEEVYVDGDSDRESMQHLFQAIKMNKHMRCIRFTSEEDIKMENTNAIANVLTNLTDLTIESRMDVLFPQLTFLHLLPKLQVLNIRGANVHNMTDEVIYTLFHKRLNAGASHLEISVNHTIRNIKRRYCSRQAMENKEEGTGAPDESVYATAYRDRNDQFFSDIERQRILEAVVL
ncbi:hypothetical protein BDB00DRAFT_801555 [Zychaea mexicana]|uniref:uncharacterized protein n=1 Tax=Zychaea mexicana TaxID=64656 RepID=UPI0022FEB2C0|nr:uncharacterized protein BDB00DRAFT_801555 [Zychaea mexicana]KAI9498196.1 hypothetical protein BDB00DRAFT_801555 [Zychaea mexicana]